ncbi:4-hydroxy-tetrahydrodipicolinate reductase [Weissella diestrammenae]|uniref:4-hydroxy-tetrahydrodipicolinate reductase n=1 Tax=Weissella diestrammenae TaxID=1162633 RepID=UPI0023EDF36F|nr:dihydrodipicolinate reductase C-terminal domain-containing protein [Weissella diestrammenae]
MIKVIVAGGFGKLGSSIVEALEKRPDIMLVGILSQTKRVTEVPVFTTLEQIDVSADVWLDVSVPEAAIENAKFALTHQMHVVVGTSGVDYDVWQQALADLVTVHERAVLIVPNFSLSAVLLMQFAKQAAQYYADVEIMEIHDVNKKDAPSGTAKATAQMIADVQKLTYQTKPVQTSVAREKILREFRCMLCAYQDMLPKKQ